MDIASWLRKLGLERYEQAFWDNEIDAEILPRLTADDLKDIGVVVVGHRRKLLDAIAALAETTSVPRTQDDGALRVDATQAERRQLTIMFVDLVGSTELSTRLDPEDTSAIMRMYQDVVAGEIARFEGHVAKYLGDGVLAYFGYPKAHEDEAERAVRAALALTHAVGKLTTPADKPLAARVGIATGLVVVGELIGEGIAEEQAVVGETPNLAARLQTLAVPGGVVIAPSTRRLVGELFEFADLGAHDLKGFAEPVTAFSVEGEREIASRFEARSGAAQLPMVGRDQELRLLLHRWALAEAGEGQVVLLVGEAGIGKSRIIRALLDSLGGKPHTPIRYQCSPYHTESALWPVIQPLIHTAQIATGDTDAARLDKLEALLEKAGARDAASLIADLIGLDGAERYGELDLSPQLKRARTLDTLVAQLLGLAAVQPVLIVVEDAHWIDPTTLELIEQCLDRIATESVLILLTSRPDRQPQLATHPHITKLTLNRLARAGVEAIVTRLAGDRLPDETIGTIVARTDGVPLFVEELTKAVLESSHRCESSPAGEYGSTSSVGVRDDIVIPATLYDALLARLDGLGPAKEVIQIAAVIGRDFRHSILAEIAGRPEPELEVALKRIISSELISHNSGPPQASYTFKHALIRDVAYESLLKSRRRELHLLAAQTLEARFPVGPDQTPEILAHHYSEAGACENAIRCWSKAGRNALERSAALEAVTHFSRGLDFIQRLPQNKERDLKELDLLSALGPAIMACRGHGAQEAGDVYKRAQTLCDSLGDVGYRAAILQGLRLFYMADGDFHASHAAGQALLALAGRTGDQDQQVEAHRGLAVTYYFRGEFIDSREHSKKGIGLYDRRRRRAHAFRYDADPGVTLHSYAGWTLQSLGFPDQALRESEQALAIADESQLAYAQVEALAWRTALAAMRRSPNEADRFAEQTSRLAADQGFQFYMAHSMFMLGWARASKGDHELGVSEMRRGLEAINDLGTGISVPRYQSMVAEVLGELGEIAEALSLVDQAINLIGETDSRAFEAEIHRIKGDLVRRRDGWNSNESEASYRRAISIARAQHAKIWELRATTSLAKLWSEQGQCPESRDVLVPIYSWFNEGFDTADLMEAKTLLDELT